ncbi:MAG: carboxypeptidase-like regulatory domain-containing protein, partial [Flavobacteriaceae bacterium]|nr:carboxypeptidase-like regulatory domain-containing protein [Flavobacteriaceae bacterium]
MKHYFFVFVLFCVTVSFAQTKPFKISGTLVTDTEKTALESATIYLERVKDSSLVTYTISDKNGKFSLESKTTDKSLNLYISYVGYRTHFQNVIIDKSEISLSTINLKTDANALDEVLIKSRAPVTIKKDTLEFNV